MLMLIVQYVLPSALCMIDYVPQGSIPHYVLILT
jgi:hypothetical protein